MCGIYFLYCDAAVMADGTEGGEQEECSNFLRAKLWFVLNCERFAGHPLLIGIFSCIEDSNKNGIFFEIGHSVEQSLLLIYYSKRANFRHMKF